MLARFWTNWPLNIANGNIKQYNHFENSLKNLKTKTCSLEISPKCLPKTNGEKYIYTEMIQMFISTSFTIVPNGNNLPLTGE